MLPWSNPRPPPPSPSSGSLSCPLASSERTASASPNSLVGEDGYQAGLVSNRPRADLQASFPGLISTPLFWVCLEKDGALSSRRNCHDTIRPCNSLWCAVHALKSNILWFAVLLLQTVKDDAGLLRHPTGTRCAPGGFEKIVPHERRQLQRQSVGRARA